MKQTFSILLLLLLLTGCSTDSTSSNAKTNAADEIKSESTIDQDILDNYQPNSQVTDDRSLQQLNQSYTDDKGKATLKAVNNVNKTYKIGPIEVTVKEMKLIHLRPDYSMIDYFHALTHDEEFDFVKVFVEIKNTSAEKVHFAPIALLTTNTGEKFDWEKDIYLEGLNGEIEANSTKMGNLGFIVNASNTHEHNDEENSEDSSHTEEHEEEVKDIKWIEITTSDVFDKDENKIEESKNIKIEF